MFLMTFFQPIGSPTTSKQPQVMLEPRKILMMTKMVNTNSSPDKIAAVALVRRPKTR